MAFYKKFMNQGPAYYGDLDEEDGALLQFEREAEKEGKPTFAFFCRTTTNILFQIGKNHIQMFEKR